MKKAFPLFEASTTNMTYALCIRYHENTFYQSIENNFPSRRHIIKFRNWIATIVTYPIFFFPFFFFYEISTRINIAELINYKKKIPNLFFSMECRTFKRGRLYVVEPICRMHFLMQFCHANIGARKPLENRSRVTNHLGTNAVLIPFRFLRGERRTSPPIWKN